MLYSQWLQAVPRASLGGHLANKAGSWHLHKQWASRGPVKPSSADDIASRQELTWACNGWWHMICNEHLDN